MKLYKITDQNNKTRAGKINETVWGPNVTHTASGSGTELCTDGVIHAYLDPRLAVILNPIHAVIVYPKLWEAEGEIVVRDGQLLVGVKSLTTIKEIPLPVITDEQKVKFAILCALEVYQEETFVSWANKWLSGEDHSGVVKDAAGAWSRRANITNWSDPHTSAHCAASAANTLSEPGSEKVFVWAAYTMNSATWALAAVNKYIDLIAILDKAMK